MSHVSFANVKTDVKTGSGDACVIFFFCFPTEDRSEREARRKCKSRREMADKRVEEEVEESVVT